MTHIKILVCFFCYEDGDIVPATHKYQPPDTEDTIDVCNKHAKTCREAGLTTTKLSDAECKEETDE